MAVIMFCDRLVPSMTGIPAMPGATASVLAHQGHDEGHFSG